MSMLLLVVACVRGDDDVLRDPAATLRNRWAITRLRFEAITKRFVDEAPNATRSLARSDAPSPARPFVFLHQRKTGGTTLRKGLHRRAQQLGVHSWLPCFDDVPCQSYAAPEALANVSLLGGHLAWPDVAARLPGGFDCFTVFREPVARVESCWNFRFVQQPQLPNWKARGATPREPFHAMNATALRAALPVARSLQREGCNNEPYRVLGPFSRGDEDAVSSLTSADAASDVDVATDALFKTLEHAGRCVVGVLERCDDTAEVLAHFQPWAAAVAGSECAHDATMLQRGSTARAGLDAAQVDAVRRENALEVHAYAAANAMLDAQLAVARGANPRRRTGDGEGRRAWLDAADKVARGSRDWSRATTAT